jgi:periplasmic protein TonB
MARDIDSILYELRPTPTSADLAIYMHRIWSAEAATPKMQESEPVAATDKNDLVAAAVAVPAAATEAPKRPVTHPGVAPMPAWDAPASATTAPPVSKKRSMALPMIIVAVLVIGGIAAFLVFRGRGATTTTGPQSRPAATRPSGPAPASATAPAASNTGTSAATASLPPATGSVAAQPQAPNQDLVNQEVQKRLAAERARLEQQGRTQPSPPLTASVAAPAIVNRTPPAQQQPAPAPVTQTVAPPPVQTASTPPPVVPTATQPVTQTQAPPPASEPVAAAVREGDLVPAGTTGLVPARVLHRGLVPYPPMAKAQHVEGTVILSVLVSETGQVLEIRILRGISRGVGLNEAAEEIMRRSTFSPPTKDGVRVKAWTTVPVDFKL